MQYVWSKFFYSCGTWTHTHIWHGNQSWIGCIQMALIEVIGIHFQPWPKEYWSNHLASVNILVCILERSATEDTSMQNSGQAERLFGQGWGYKEVYQYLGRVWEYSENRRDRNVMYGDIAHVNHVILIYLNWNFVYCSVITEKGYIYARFSENKSCT